ncbi:protein-tyrosine phosphatase [Ferrithrix thermotolerans DSM 19514]|uniref:Protein-tyrosine phosphatase n=1 Tax=Ferrithrix thermotolerans DSM 19514 TaxID=1121881 RepID=A0A1M4UUC0_9ACTN|nr:tyrosine-protein phosphatase [Ferrithrix thermotolerans]SHE60200.1 protein-tyrosine phosphatase [Ferrithrix thermotolerans DSM 19514]
MDSYLPAEASQLSRHCIAIAQHQVAVASGQMKTEQRFQIASVTSFGVEPLEMKFQFQQDRDVIYFLTEDELPPRPAILTLMDDTPTVAVQRHIELEGLTNLRDFGGYSGSGGTVPWGRLYRSENLSKLSDRQWEHLDRLGITRVIDLRNASEKELQPTTLPQSSKVELHEIEVTGRIKGYDDALLAIGDGHLTEITENDISDMYLDILNRHIDDLALAVALAENNQDGATLVHCTAGKDRTGLVAAILQLRAGISPLQVQRDYLLSNLYRTPDRLRQLEGFFEHHRIDPLSVRPFLAAPWQAMSRALEELSTRHPDLLNSKVDADSL